MRKCIVILMVLVLILGFTSNVMAAEKLESVATSIEVLDDETKDIESSNPFYIENKILRVILISISLGFSIISVIRIIYVISELYYRLIDMKRWIDKREKELEELDEMLKNRELKEKEIDEEIRNLILGYLEGREIFGDKRNSDVKELNVVIGKEVEGVKSGTDEELKIEQMKSEFSSELEGIYQKLKDLQNH